MDQYHQVREAILTTNQRLITQIRAMAASQGVDADVFQEWEQTSASIARHILDQVVRIAVVGAIKSGKSTLVNSLLEHDYLKRGAGVVTSIVTRLRQGQNLKAHLFLKSWDEINAELNQALTLFPTGEWQVEKHGFDIRREKDRQDLDRALHALNRDQWVGLDGLNANSVLLSSYLKGYEHIQEVMSADTAVLEFDAHRFDDHRNFVGQDALAVYLKDVQLDIMGDVLAGNIEMADCQGSDSPNPLHLAMIQDYLLKAHLIVYVISSRTGVRQADIRFLTMIRRMGIGDNMLFVCNCDFNEHDSLEDLTKLVNRVTEELTLVVPEPQVCAFSALYHLFSVIPAGNLAARDRERLAQWNRIAEMTVYSFKGLARLKQVMAYKLTRERASLLLKNQLERIDVTSSAMTRWLRLNRDLLQRSVDEVNAVARRMQAHQAYVHQTQSMIQSTLEGAVQKIQKELKGEIDRFFDRHSGPILPPLLNFINEYQPDLSVYEEQLGEMGFTHGLYKVFQEFKQVVDRFITEKINPDIIGFVQLEERQLAERYQAVAQPFMAMTGQVFNHFDQILSDLKPPLEGASLNHNGLLDLNEIKESAGIFLPPSSTAMHYSTQIKTEAILRLGVYNVIRMLRKALKRSVGRETAEGIKAIKDGVGRIKRETERSILLFYKDFQENLKFQYMLRLAELTAQRLRESLIEQYRSYGGDLKEMVVQIERQRGDKTQVEAVLAAVESELGQIRDQLDILRPQIGDLSQ